VPLGFLVEEPAHGYEVYRRFTESLSGLWAVSESQMYATIKRLQERGLVVASDGGEHADGDPPRGPGSAKRLLSPSEAGRAAFASWLAEPTPCSPRILRLEFITRLYFASRLDRGSVAGILASQRAEAEIAIARLRAYRDAGQEGLDPSSLAQSFSDGQLRAVLEWLDGSVAAAVYPRR